MVIKTLDPELDPDPQLVKCWIRIRIKSMRIRNPAPNLLVVGMIVDAAPVLSPGVVSLPKKREDFCQMAEIIGSVSMRVSVS